MAADRALSLTLTRTMVAMAITGASIGTLLSWHARADSQVNEAFVQTQIARPLDVAPSAAAERLLVIAHNAGDATTTITYAVKHHARTVEIDSVDANGQLRARHDPRPRSPKDIVSRSQTVSRAWALARAPGILLDLKTSGLGTADLVNGLIAAHPTTHVLVSTSDAQTLDRVEPHSASVLRLLSVGAVAELDSVLERPAASSTALIQGVSIADGVLNATTVRELQQHHLWIQSWTVDTMARANQLAAWGVNGITTDNLTMIAALAHAAN